MSRAQSKQQKDKIRYAEYKRRKEIQLEKSLNIQTQIVNDYIATHNQIAHKTSRYPLTEKVFTGTPEALTAILTSDLSTVGELQITPGDYPEGLVL
jgi:hypothetical protein